MGIERRYCCALPRQFECHCAIAATDIEQLRAGNPAEKSSQQLPLKASVIWPRRLDLHRTYDSVSFSTARAPPMRRSEGRLLRPDAPRVMTRR